MTRRPDLGAPARHLGLGLGLALGLGAPFAARAQPLEGAFLHFGYAAGDDELPAAVLRAQVAELASLGVGTLVVSQVRVKRPEAGCGGSAADFEWLAGFPGGLQGLLDLAARHGMGVYVGLVATALACPAFFDAGAPNAALAVAETRSAVEALLPLAAHPAFRGWYLPDEPDPFAGAPLEAHLARLVAAVKARTPAAPVVAAPSLAFALGACGGAPCDPAAVAARALGLRQATGLDVQAWQDGVGAAAVRLAGWDRATGFTVEAYLQALRGALGEAGLWTVVELFTWAPALLRFPGYQPAAASRLNEQLWEARHGPGGLRVAWLPQRHLSAVHPGRLPGAARLLAAHRAAAGRSGQWLAAPAVSYAWESPPSPAYPDPGGLLLDRRAGDPTDLLGGWCGVLGSAALVVDLGAPRRIDWIALDLLSAPAAGVRLPRRLDISCAQVPGAWPAAPDVSVAPPAEAAPGESVLGNDAPLGLGCRWLRLALDNPGAWTFVGELELIGG
jgi:hypothetical protein